MWERSAGVFVSRNDRPRQVPTDGAGEIVASLPSVEVSVGVGVGDGSGVVESVGVGSGLVAPDDGAVDGPGAVLLAVLLSVALPVGVADDSPEVAVADVEDPARVGDVVMCEDGVAAFLTATGRMDARDPDDGKGAAGAGVDTLGSGTTA